MNDTNKINSEPQTPNPSAEREGFGYTIYTVRVSVSQSFYWLECNPAGLT